MSAAVVVPNEGQLVLLSKMLKDALAVDEDYLLKLFSNAVTPDVNTTISTFTEANFPGYAPLTLTRAGWSTDSIAFGKAQITYPIQSFFCTGGTVQLIYGHFFLSSTSQKVLWAESYTVPVAMVPNAILNISPVFTLRNDVC